MRPWTTTLAAMALLVFPASAKVTAQSQTGFALLHEADVAVPPQKAFDDFVRIGDWWDMSHSYSHDGSRMHMDIRPGGTWHETLPDGGFVSHLQVSQVDPGKRLLLTGGLGPLAFMGVSGSLTATFEPSGTGTHVKIVYAVGGFDPDDFKSMSAAVDAVWHSQFARFRNYAATGKP